MKKKYSVLIVDDAFFIRNLIKRAIGNKPSKDYPYEFEIAGEGLNGEEGLMLYKALRPDVVTVDVNMGSLGGVAFIKKVRAFDKNAQVIVVSSSLDNKLKEEIAKLGCYYIQKPFQEAYLWTKLDMIAESLISKPKEQPKKAEQPKPVKKETPVKEVSKEVKKPVSKPIEPIETAKPIEVISEKVVEEKNIEDNSNNTKDKTTSKVKDESKATPNKEKENSNKGNKNNKSNKQKKNNNKKKHALDDENSLVGTVPQELLNSYKNKQTNQSNKKNNTQNNQLKQKTKNKQKAEPKKVIDDFVVDEGLSIASMRNKINQNKHKEPTVEKPKTEKEINKPKMVLEAIEVVEEIKATPIKNDDISTKKETEVEVEEVVVTTKVEEPILIIEEELHIEEDKKEILPVIDEVKEETLEIVEEETLDIIDNDEVLDIVDDEVLDVANEETLDIVDEDVLSIVEEETLDIVDSDDVLDIVDEDETLDIIDEDEALDIIEETSSFPNDEVLDIVDDNDTLDIVDEDDYSNKSYAPIYQDEELPPAPIYNDDELPYAPIYKEDDYTNSYDETLNIDYKQNTEELEEDLMLIENVKYEGHYEDEDSELEEDNGVEFFEIDIEKKEEINQEELTIEEELLLNVTYSMKDILSEDVEEEEVPEDEESISILKEIEKASQAKVTPTQNEEIEIKTVEEEFSKIEEPIGSFDDDDFDFDDFEGVEFDIDNGSSEDSVVNERVDSMPNMYYQTDSARETELNSHIPNYNKVNNEISHNSSGRVKIAPPKDNRLKEIYSSKMEKDYNVVFESQKQEPVEPVKKQGLFSRLFKKKK